MLIDLLGMPSYSFTWQNVFTGAGIPQRTGVDTKGLYAVSNATELLYIGKSKNLTRRLSQFIAASVGGWGQHSGGWRFFVRREGAPHAGDLKFDVWEGTEAYDRENEAIGKHGGALNVQSTIPEIKIEKYVGAVDKGSDLSTRLEVLDSLLECLVESFGCKPQQSEREIKRSWSYLSKRIEDKSDRKIYAGTNGKSVGIWVYVDEREWFPADRYLSEVTDREGLRELVRKLQLAWNEWED